MVTNVAFTRSTFPSMLATSLDCSHQVYKTSSVHRTSFALPARSRSSMRCIQGSLAADALSERLVRGFRVVQGPALHNTRYSVALKSFVGTAILAYECGYSEGLVRSQLDHLPLPEFANSQQAAAFQDEDSEELLTGINIVWITIMLCPQHNVMRWTPGSPVTPDTLALWRGFVEMIVWGWIEKRWAWYPIERLQMELSVATGQSQPPSVVAEYARFVFSTLEHIAPQFPSQ